MWSLPSGMTRGAMIEIGVAVIALSVVRRLLITGDCQLTTVPTPGHWIGAYRAIRTGQLHGLPHFHTRPVNVMVCHGPVGDVPWEISF